MCFEERKLSRSFFGCTHMFCNSCTDKFESKLNPLCCPLCRADPRKQPRCLERSKTRHTRAHPSVNSERSHDLSEFVGWSISGLGVLTGPDSEGVPRPFLPGIPFIRPSADLQDARLRTDASSSPASSSPSPYRAFSYRALPPPALPPYLPPAPRSPSDSLALARLPLVSGPHAAWAATLLGVAPLLAPFAASQVAARLTAAASEP